MSRQRKPAAVLQLLRNKDLEIASRGPRATLSVWCDAFLAAGEASLTTRQKDGEELTSERLKDKLGDTLLKIQLRGPRHYDGTIVPATIDTMGGHT